NCRAFHGLRQLRLARCVGLAVDGAGYSLRRRRVRLALRLNDARLALRLHDDARLAGVLLRRLLVGGVVPEAGAEAVDQARTFGSAVVRAAEKALHAAERSARRGLILLAVAAGVVDRRGLPGQQCGGQKAYGMAHGSSPSKRRVRQDSES